jgi:MFS family permease
LLVFVGLYIRLKITETPDFIRIMDKQQRVRIPVVAVFAKHPKAIILGTASTIATFLLFYIMTVFTLSWGTTVLHYAKDSLLVAQMISMVFFGIGIPLAAVIADKKGTRTMLISSSIGIFLLGLFFAPLFTTGNIVITVGFLSTGLFLMGLNYGPVGTALANIFPPEVRYTGASLCFTLAGILGASLTPYMATTLAKEYGLAYVGYYLSFGAAISIAALLASGPLMRKRS